VMWRALLILALLCLLLPSAAWAQSDEPMCENLAPANADPTFYLGLGAAASEEGDFTRAIIVYTCAIERNPSYAPAYVDRGRAHAAQFNFPEALADYNQALDLDGNLIAAYNNRGVLYSNQANYGLAIADFTVITLTAPDFAPAFYNRALVHAAEGNYDLAIDDLLIAIDLDPEFAAPHSALGAVYLALAAESYQDYEIITNRPAQPDAGDTLEAMELRLETDDPSALLALQMTVR